MKKIILMFLIMFLAPMPLIQEVFSKDNKDKGMDNQKTVLIMTFEPGGKETDQFDCYDYNEIYVDFTFEAEKWSNHILEAFWIGPDGKQQAYEEYPVLGNRVWIWMKIPKEKEGVFDSNIGMPDYIYKWMLKIRVDRETVAEKTFNVTCSL